MPGQKPKTQHDYRKAAAGEKFGRNTKPKQVREDYVNDHKYELKARDAKRTRSSLPFHSNQKAPYGVGVKFRNGAEERGFAEFYATLSRLLSNIHRKVLGGKERSRQEIIDGMSARDKKLWDIKLSVGHGFYAEYVPTYNEVRDWYLLRYSPSRKLPDHKEGKVYEKSIEYAQGLPGHRGLTVPQYKPVNDFFNHFVEAEAPLRRMTLEQMHDRTLEVRDYVKLRIKGKGNEGQWRLHPQSKVTPPEDKLKPKVKAPVGRIHVHKFKKSTVQSDHYAEKSSKEEIPKPPHDTRNVVKGGSFNAYGNEMLNDDHPSSTRDPPSQREIVQEVFENASTGEEVEGSLVFYLFVLGVSGTEYILTFHSTERCRLQSWMVNTIPLEPITIVGSTSFIQPELIVRVSPIVEQLNGNNGSHTNTDDHAKGFRGKRNKKRGKKGGAAQAPEQISAPAIVENDDPAPQLVDDLPLPPVFDEEDDEGFMSVQTSEISVQADLEKLVEEEFLEKLDTRPLAYSYNGILYRIDPAKPFTCELVEPENRLNYLVKEDGVVTGRLPSFSQFGRQFEGRDISISTRIRSLMRNSLGVLPDEARNYVAVYTFATRNLSIFGTDNVLDHVDFFCYKNARVATPNATLLVAAATRTSLNSGLVMQDKTVLAPDVPYLWNQGWSIVASHGFSMDVKGDGRFTQYPTFASVPQEIKHSDGDKFYFFKFTNVDQMPVYANDPRVACGALSRLFKCRFPAKGEDDDSVREAVEEERRARINQFKLIDTRESRLLRAGVEVAGGSALLPGDNQDGIITGRKVIVAGHRKRAHAYNIPRHSEFMDCLDDNINKYTKDNWWTRFARSVCDNVSEAFIQTAYAVYTPIYWLLNPLTQLLLYVDLPHYKRPIRKKWVDNPEDLKKILEDTCDFKAKVKKEYGKVGKAARLFQTRDQGALVGNVPNELVKFVTSRPFQFKAIDTDSYIGNIKSMDAKFSDCATPETSDKLFQEIYNLPEGHFRYNFMSDDGFVAYNNRGIVELYETDISSCDSSNGFAISFILLYIAHRLGYSDDYLVLLAASSRPTTLRNPFEYGEYVKLLSELGFEFSGELTTTAKNNVASICIAFGTYLQLRENPGISIKEALEKGAHMFGWLLKVDRRMVGNKMTFLKRAYSEDSKRSWLVFGPVLRSFGAVDGKPTAAGFGLTKAAYKKKDYADLTEILIRQKADMLQHEPSSCIMNALRERAYGAHTVEEVISRADICERYDLQEWELAELVDQITSLKFGDVFIGNAIEAIFAMDYGTRRDSTIDTPAAHRGDIDNLL